MLRQWVAHPLQNQKLINDRHHIIRFFTKRVSREQLTELSSYLKHLKNIHRLLSKLKQSRATCTDWQYILKVIHSPSFFFNKEKTNIIYTFLCFKKVCLFLYQDNT